MTDCCTKPSYQFTSDMSQYEQICQNTKDIAEFTSESGGYDARITKNETDINTIKAEQITQNTNISNNANVSSNALSKASTNENDIANHETRITTAEGEIDVIQADKVDVAFKNVAVSGQTSIVADNKEDTVNIVAGANITLSTNPTTKALSISATGDIGSQAQNVSVADAGGYFATADAESVLQEIGAVNVSQQSSLDTHTSQIADHEARITQNESDISSNQVSITSLSNDKENVSNKTTTIRDSASASDTLYPSEKAVATAIDSFSTSSQVARVIADSSNYYVYNANNDIVKTVSGANPTSMLLDDTAETGLIDIVRDGGVYEIDFRGIHVANMSLYINGDTTDTNYGGMQWYQSSSNLSGAGAVILSSPQFLAIANGQVLLNGKMRIQLSKSLDGNSYYSFSHSLSCDNRDGIAGTVYQTKVSGKNIVSQSNITALNFVVGALNFTDGSEIIIRKVL